MVGSSDDNDDNIDDERKTTVSTTTTTTTTIVITESTSTTIRYLVVEESPKSNVRVCVASRRVASRGIVESYTFCIMEEKGNRKKTKWQGRARYGMAWHGMAQEFRKEYPCVVPFLSSLVCIVHVHVHVPH